MKAVTGGKKLKTVKEAEINDVNLAVLEKSLLGSKTRLNGKR